MKFAQPIQIAEKKNQNLCKPRKADERRKRGLNKHVKYTNRNQKDDGDPYLALRSHNPHHQNQCSIPNQMLGRCGT